MPGGSCHRSPARVPAGPVAANAPDPPYGGLGLAFLRCHHGHADASDRLAVVGVDRGWLKAPPVVRASPRVGGAVRGGFLGGCTRPWARLTLLLGAPAAWLLVAYLGSLAALLVTSLYKIDDTGLIVEQLSLTNFEEIFTEPIYRTVAVRTIGVAASVTVIDMVLALPAAYFIAKVATARWRALLVAAVLVPLWASYLVKAYTWRAILGTPGGVLESTLGHSPGYSTPSVVLVLAYLWLPYMILPIYAGLERLPDSLVEASGDLGTVDHDVPPRGPTCPAPIHRRGIDLHVLAFAGRLHRGRPGGWQHPDDRLRGVRELLRQPAARGRLRHPPIVIMIAYLLGARRTGAFENL